jgi:DtxR family Mn-dependent transcriptional regulator
LPTSSEENYLKAIFLLPGAVGTTALAQRLKVRKPSVTSMVKRLAESGLVEHSPRRGVRLTDPGRRAALQVLRRHRLLKALLVESLGLDPSEISEEAEILEHHLSDRLVEAMDWALGHPLEDPHGHQIPDSEGRLKERSLVPLESLEEGTRATVRELHSDASPRLSRWFELGLVPGATVVVDARREMDDVLAIRVADRTEVVGRGGLSGIFVEPLLTA